CCHMSNSICNLSHQHSFPTRRSSDRQTTPGGGEAVSAALEVCRGCPVRLECLIWAGEGGDWWSVAGGVEPVDRGETLMWECRARSEEHTTELQSRENLVCRLLLEKTT